ncbi:hypothetical protein CCR95_16640 [Thiocystis minor]|nr:DUF3616 domain-containing protein [Thiocystis minor]MBK5965666.1 hypothetical protein [Thiocystis minor]
MIARIPVEDSGETFALAKKTRRKDKELTAAQLRGDQQGNVLTESLREDKHLGPFLAIPGKDNGFDIEGLAVVGERLFLGLRGPVLRGWAVVLEVEVAMDDDDPARLGLKAIGEANGPYRKHFLHLGGLGIRDLCVSGADLLILAGPSMDLDGPVAIFRWPGGAKPDDASIVPADRLERLVDVPYGRGSDRAEGVAWFTDDSQSRRMLVVYDAAADHRQPDDHSIVADLFMLPAM